MPLINQEYQSFWANLANEKNQTLAKHIRMIVCAFQVVSDFRVPVDPIGLSIEDPIMAAKWFATWPHKVPIKCFARPRPHSCSNIGTSQTIPFRLFGACHYFVVSSSFIIGFDGFAVIGFPCWVIESFVKSRINQVLPKLMKLSGEL